MSLWKQISISAFVLAVSAVIFGLTIIGPDTLFGSSANANHSAGFSGRPAPLVVLSPVTQATADNIVKSVGSAQSTQGITLYPEASGRIDQIFLRPGEHVEVGDIILSLDSSVESLALDRARLAYEDAQQQVERFETLSQRNTVSEVQLLEAMSEREASRLDLLSAEDALARRSIKAPFAGEIGLMDLSVGDYVTSATPVTTLDNRSEIRVDFRIPERFSPHVSAGQLVSITTPALTGVTLEGVVTHTDSRVDPLSRTLIVHATVDNEDDQIRPGMSFEVTLSLTGQHHLSVPSPAVLWDSDGSYVFRAQDGVAMRQPVEIVRRQNGLVLIEGELSLGDQVVTEGTQSIRPGQPFREFQPV